MPDETRPNIIPVLLYEDATAAAEWLGKAFGFQEKAMYKDSDGHVVHAELRFAAGLLMMGSAGGHSDNPWSRVTHGISVTVQDIDAHYARAKAAGAEIVRELADTDYGAREYTARDLDGNLWSFGTYDPYEPSTR